jgi:pyridoxamine 5'-phosphate oxidase
VLAEHRAMETLWQKLQPQLAAIAAGQAATLDGAAVADFSELYLRHMDKEEGHIAPMAKRLFSAEQMQRLGNAMRTRRGIALPEGA